MTQDSKHGKSGDKVTYTLRPHKQGQSAFSDVRLPNGTIIRRVDESVHRRALSNASNAFKEKA